MRPSAVRRLRLATEAAASVALAATHAPLLAAQAALAPPRWESDEEDDGGGDEVGGGLHAFGGATASRVGGPKAAAAWVQPAWVRAVPTCVADLQPTHERLAYNWLIQSGYVVGGPFDNELRAHQRRQLGWRGEGDYTLTLFSGSQAGQKGAWFPHSEWSVFLRWLALDVRHWRRQPLFYNQLLSGQTVMRLVFDCDLRGPRPLTVDELLRVCRVAHLQVCAYRGASAADSGVLVCRTPVVRKDAYGAMLHSLRAGKAVTRFRMRALNGQCDCPEEISVRAHFGETLPVETVNDRWYGEGLHLYWDVFVTVEQALQIRGSVVYALTRDCGPRDAAAGENAWAQVFDSKPIESQHLRLPYCAKSAPCAVCGVWRAIRASCPGCHGRGRILDLTRPYTPLTWLRGGVDAREESVVADDAALLAWRDNVYALLVRCSLHAPVGQGSSFGMGEFVVPPGHPMVVPSTVRSAAQTRRYLDGSEGTVVTRDFVEDSRSLRAMPAERYYVPPTAAVWRLLQTFIQTQVHPCYAHLLLESVFTTRARTFYIVSVQGFHERYCLRVQREHSSNKIYFRLHAERFPQRRFVLRQKCHSTAKGKECCGYESAAVPLTDVLVRHLFQSDAISLPELGAAAAAGRTPDETHQRRRQYSSSSSQTSGGDGSRVDSTVTAGSTTSSPVRAAASGDGDGCTTTVDPRSSSVVAEGGGVRSEPVVTDDSAQSGGGGGGGSVVAAVASLVGRRRRRVPTTPAEVAARQQELRALGNSLSLLRQARSSLELAAEQPPTPSSPPAADRRRGDFVAVLPPTGGGGGGRRRRKMSGSLWLSV